MYQNTKENTEEEKRQGGGGEEENKEKTRHILTKRPNQMGGSG